jgi:hypothetical protein
MGANLGSWGGKNLPNKLFYTAQCFLQSYQINSQISPTPIFLPTNYIVSICQLCIYIIITMYYKYLLVSISIYYLLFYV